ncbi:23S rRNA (uracil(1939)-C(5))-methyltransferase RlmD [Enterocloster bolteae]|uniref:23S rRNA (uracil(1939)-C(5))-methyltransferase RlmD n=2 Tax=Enterocloster bolteae TaxID=208479 RepID=UPI001D14798C|nr:23S rRNA (uracil(1939)-C(5))-methyltransferase RlmD [Enterocloster bolteae]MCC3389953.1 23S rRNA (uracil(1939)-C(5))-methyltransferase RlmD [Enterocloster bolteae]
MKKGDIYEGTVEKIEFPNKGILHIDGERVVVKNAIPGQKIQCVITKRRKGKSEARTLEILAHSPAEKPEEACPHFGICGGCIYQSLPYEEQLNIKKEQVKSLLDTVVEDGTYEFQGIKASPISSGYRNKMEFSFGDEVKDGPLALGMHKRGSFYDIVTTPECRIVHPDFCRILVATKEYFEELGIAFYKKLQHQGYLRHLLVRRAVKTGEILVDLVTSTQRDYLGERTEEEVLAEWTKKLVSLPLDGRLAGILHTENDSLADVVQSDATHILYGQDYFYEELLGLRFRISPFSFFQTNSLGAEVLYDTARGFVGDTKDRVVFDLYSGTGTIAQILAPVAKKVVGVEIVEEAVRSAQVNARLNGLENCEFLAGDVLKVMDELQDKPDLIVVDPPRDGIHPKALGKIIDFGVDRIVYISCKPTSLVRDLVVLQDRGYRVEKVCGVDMFPGTGNVETVCLLSKLKSTQHIEVEIEMDELDLTAAEKKATYDEIKAYVLEHSGLKVSSLYIAQVKQKCGIIERENYNKPKSEDAKQPQCPPEKETAIMEALRHFEMI